MYGDVRLLHVRHVFFSSFLLKTGCGGKNIRLLLRCYQWVSFKFLCRRIFSSYSWFSHHSVTEKETGATTKEIKVSKKSLVLFGMEMGGLCSFEFYFFLFLSVAAKNARVKTDKTALRLSHLPKCGRKHESRINCFSQNRFSGFIWPGNKAER